MTKTALSKEPQIDFSSSSGELQRTAPPTPRLPLVHSPSGPSVANTVPFTGFSEGNIEDFRANAMAARIAGRIHASSIPESEHASLLRERQSLLDKKFDGSMTPKESRRLEYIRWSLDRIEDAKHGAALDVLEASIAMYEQFLSELAALKENLSRPLKQNRRK